MRVFLFLLSLWALVGTAAAQILHALVVSDVHFDSRFSPGAPRSSWCRGNESGAREAEYGRYGCDTAPILARKSLEAAGSAARAAEAAFVLLLGDLPGHALPAYEENRAAVREVVRKLRESIIPPPGQTGAQRRSIPILPLVGNNEGYPNYNLSLDPFDSRLQDLYDIYREEGLDVPEEFLEAGRYVYDLDVGEGKEYAPLPENDEIPDSENHGTESFGQGRPPRIRIVALNTLYYSVRYSHLEEADDDPLNQLEWLSQVLDHARDERVPVLIAAHLPPGVNGFTGAENLADRFSRRLAEILGENSDVISAAFYGHYHHEQLKLYDAMRWNSVPAIVCPSISPNNYNNPGFLVAEFSWNPEASGTVASKLKLRDYYHYSADLEECNMHGNVTFVMTYKFSDAYAGALRDPSGVSGLNVRTLLFQTVTDKEVMREYTKNARSGYAADRGRNVCAIRSPNRRLYHECIEEFP